MENKKLLELINLVKRNLNLSDLGILYAHNGYDDERYRELKEINLKILDILTDENISLEKLHDFYLPIKEYPTPKVEVRGLLLNENDEILMVEEKLDPGKWSIPGGWCDIGFSPKEVMIKEMKEETGLDVEIVRVLAILDKKFYNHPSEPFYTYKIIFLCKKVDGNLKTTFDITNVKYFNIDNLPPLSTARILEEQIKMLFDMTKKNIIETYCE